MRGLMVDVGFFLKFFFHGLLSLSQCLFLFCHVFSCSLCSPSCGLHGLGPKGGGGTVTTCAQPPRTDIPQPHTDLSHSAWTFSEVGTRCTATSHMTSLLVYSLFSQELSSLSLNLILDIPNSCDITP